MSRGVLFAVYVIRTPFCRFESYYGQCTVHEQKPFIDSVLHAIDAHPRDRAVRRLFFLTGAGGTGKTFVYNVQTS